MSELQQKSKRRRRTSKKTFANKGENATFDDFLPKEDETQKGLQIKADFLAADNTIRTAEFSLDKQFRFKRSNNSAKLALNIFTLLSGNKKPNLKTLIIFSLESKILSLNDLKSLLPKGKGGRKKKYLNRETGEILNMKEPYKTICEKYNQAEEPEQITEIIIEKFFKGVRTDLGKISKKKFVCRILRRNKDFLTRPYVQK